MRLEHANLTWTMLLLFLAGVPCEAWKVEYQLQHICAVRGSSVVIPCSFHHPDVPGAKRVMWGHVRSRHLKGRLIFSSGPRSVATRRFQYIGDKHHNCSLKIHQVRHDDAGKYIMRFNDITSGPSGKAGPTLKVVDLNILVTNPTGNRTTKEGDSVNLTCTNSCDGGDLSSAFTWFKNGQPVSEGPVLYLSNISSTHSGNYTCSLTTQDGTTSGVTCIDVEYGPKDTLVSVRPSTEADAGRNIGLTCSSRANPPVENYTWFEIADDNVVDVGHQPVFFSGESGQYFCCASNKHGSQNSSVVTLKIQPHWAKFTRYALITGTAAMLLTVTAVISVRRLNKKRTRDPKADCEEDTQNTDYVNWLTCDNSQWQEENWREGGTTTEVVYASVCFHNGRQSNMQRQVDPRGEEEVIYSTVCRKQLLNPSHNVLP